MKWVSPKSVHVSWKGKREIALLDVREEYFFAFAHPLFAASMPLSRLELEIFTRIPRRTTRIIVYDDGEGLANVAAERLSNLGYDDVALLDGGLAGWRAAGYELFADVNSPSKAFGELVEHYRRTPSISAPDLEQLQRARADVVVLDARTFGEYQTMSIPGGISVPGAELVLRAPAIAPSRETLVVVNCAGRTRSIIGAQSLINAGLPNRVVALRNGAIGWTLANQSLAFGQSQRFPEPSPETEAASRRAARDTAYRAGVREIAAPDIASLEEASRTLYRFDVRTAEEFARSHPSGFLSAPGGQLVQETDVAAPVRGARILLYDDRGVRADMTASWLAQMGWDVYVCSEPLSRMDTSPSPAEPRPPFPSGALISPEDLDAAIGRGDVLLVDLASSAVFRRGHIPGAAFLIRSQIATDLTAAGATRIIVTSPDGAAALYAAPEIAAATGAEVLILEGGSASWMASGRQLEEGFANALSPPHDVYARPYEGAAHPREKMQAYLEWEYGLVDQLRRDASHGFSVI